MISASHNPKEYNGLKLGVGYSDTMITEEIQEIRKLIEAGNFSSGTGTNRNQDIFQEYKADILKHFSLNKNWKVVIDGCNTGSGVFYPQILREAGCEVIEQNCTPDGNFPLGVPDPTEVEVLERVSKKILEVKADMVLLMTRMGIACPWSIMRAISSGWIRSLPFFPKIS
jgi:phosphomannomutase/phosphoglucomutase